MATWDEAMHAEDRNDARRGVFVAEVLSNRPICREHYRLHLLLEHFPPSRPGQFVQVQCRGLEPPTSFKLADWPQNRPPQLTQPELTDTEPFLRRPLSLAGRIDRPDGGTELVFIYRVVGTGTRWLAGLSAEDRLSVLGPLGNGFSIRDNVPQAVLVGGGVGIPPLIYLAEAMAAAGKGKGKGEGKRVIAFCGARAADLLPLTFVPGAKIATDARPTPCIAEFSACGASSVVATDDGSVGFRGLISDAFSNWLARSGLGAGQVVVYACGPEAMMQAVAAMCLSSDIECQLALERHMACGMGTCQSCIVKTKTEPTPPKQPLRLRRPDIAAGWKFSLCCTDGPIFDARQVLW
jgi:dihydroorotate dehydrogenase electron transfer subunit